MLSRKSEGATTTVQVRLRNEYDLVTGATDEPNTASPPAAYSWPVPGAAVASVMRIEYVTGELPTTAAIATPTSIPTASSAWAVAPGGATG